MSRVQGGSIISINNRKTISRSTATTRNSCIKTNSKRLFCIQSLFADGGSFAAKFSLSQLINSIYEIRLHPSLLPVYRSYGTALYPRLTLTVKFIRIMNFRSYKHSETGINTYEIDNFFPYNQYYHNHTVYFSTQPRTALHVDRDSFPYTNPSDYNYPTLY